MPQHQQTASRESSTGGGPSASSSSSTPLGKPQPRSDWSSTGLRFQYRRGVQATPTQPPRKRRRVGPAPWKLVRLTDNGCVAVVGESFYQPALIAITGRHEWKDVQH